MPESRELKAAPSLPAITLPKGGGAISGIDEKLTVGLATGAANLSVPIPVTAARNGFGPSLALTYDSGAGNGVFGMGWQLPVPAITRKTSKGLPRYQDSQDSDVFVLSGAEDLVPLPGAPVADPSGQYLVRRYRPRAEAAFSRIERWQAADGDVHWRTVTRDNATAVFGRSQASRICDPANPGHIFSWLLDLSYDDRGNAVLYEYQAENSDGVPHSVAENGRESTANRHLKYIHYGNTAPYRPANGAGPPASWRFHVAFDYGDHDAARPALAPSAAWPCRPDSFSTYRSGFELRTHRLCRRILLFHSFPEHLQAQDVLVRSTDLSYSTDTPGDAALPAYAQVTAVVQSGYIRDPASGDYRKKSRPPLQLGYSPVIVHDTVAVAAADTLANLPAGADGKGWRLIDLDGEGLQGVLTDDDGAWYYKRNVSAYAPGGAAPAARFEPLQLVARKPVGPSASRSPQLVDLHGDGNLCVVEMSPPAAGYFRRDGDGWQPFRAFPGTPAIDWSSPDVRTVDLDGDGLADVLLTEDDAFTWYRWLAEDGFAAGERMSTSYDEDRGPHLVLAGGDNSVFLADMSGDGLSDLVRIRNGEVCYWPNLGYGRFGARVVMDGAPWFDAADTFDPRRVRLADVDGSGTADVVYLGAAGPVLWFNQSGNAFTAPTVLQGFPAIDDATSVDTVDLLGAGTTCLVWSSPLPGDGGRQLRYVDLMGGVKPHLLVSVVNNMGAETTLTYATSTRFYLEDRLAGRPWATHLAFPVHVVAREEAADRVTGTRLVSTYRYHHGYFDGVEREFRGFGMVEQSDAESVPAASGTGTFTGTPSVAGAEFALPPARTCTWFHTGAYVGGKDIAAVLAGEYWSGDPQATPLGDTVFDGMASPEEMREACRALRGRPLRTEVYADDATPSATAPYAVTQHRYQVHRLQSPTDTAYGSVYACDLESVSYHYERNVADPRVTHDMVLDVDAFGAVTKSASVAYARRGAAAVPEQSQALLTYTEHDVANVTDRPDWYRVGVPVETRTYELTGFGSPKDSARFLPDTFLPAILASAAIAFDAAPGGGPTRRLVGRSRVVYRSDDLSAVLAVGNLESMALVDRAYTLAMTPALAARIYAAKIPDATAVATGEGGFVDLDGDGCWWAPTPRVFYSPDPAHPDAASARTHFFLPQGHVDPFGGVTRIAWEHDLAVVESTDPVGNLTTSVVNYRLLQPWLAADPNANRNGVRFDELGMVVAAAVMGKALPGGADEGDSLDTTTAEAAAGDDPTSTFDYELAATPVFAHARARERHKDPAAPWLESYVYSDGMGRTVLTKAQAEPGETPVVAADGSVDFEHTDHRWVGTGRVVFDNKGNAVKAYEPFFDSNPGFTAEPALVHWGVTAITRYDPLSRAHRVDKPNGTYTTVEFDAWRSISADDNDTVLDSAWYAARSGGALGAAEQDAAAKAAAHAGTPLVADVDTLGRTVRSIADGEHGQFIVSLVLDISGRTLATVDALDRTVMATDYSVAGRVVHTSSIDAGERWILHDATGQPLREWDSRDHRVRRTYDAARRPLDVYVSTGAAAEVLAESLAYGEGQANDVADNLRGAVHESRDGAGLATAVRRDFKGNLLTAQRQMLRDVRAGVDWSSAPPPGLAAETFTTTTSYDALDRVVTVTTPDGSVTTHAYNQRSLLDGITVALRGAAPIAHVQSIDYDAKGQRLSVAYGNGATTAYTYDPESFRLVHLATTRPAGGSPVQDLTYTYDPAGNITRVVDAAQSTIFFANQLVAPVGDYSYDSIYRLRTAAGREHIGQAAGAPVSWDDGDGRAVPLPTDPQAMRNYTETFSYDLVGNITSVVHAVAGGGWTRTYAYDEPHLPAGTNRLTSTTVGATVEQYAHDANGNMVAMPHLSLLAWDHRDRLQTTARQVVAGGDPQTTWYRYESGGRRVRKATVAAGGAVRHERFYFGSYEVYREYAADGSVSLERQAVIVPDGSRHIALLETTTVDTAHPAAAPSTATRYQLSNHLDSACVELDEHAAVITYEEYYPFGATSFQAGRSAAEVSLKRYRYTGRERDEESALNHHGARYHAPWLGRWTSCDPAGLVDGATVYAYVRNNPLRLNDTAGTQGNDQTEVTVSRADPDQDGTPPAQRTYTQWIPPPPSSYGTPSTVFGNVTQSLGDEGQRGGSLSYYRGIGPNGPQTFYPFLDVEFNAIGSGVFGPGPPAATLPAGGFTAQVSARLAPFPWVPNLTLGGFGNIGPTGATGTPSATAGGGGATAQYGFSLGSRFALGAFGQYSVNAATGGAPTTHTGTFTPIVQWQPNDDVQVAANPTFSAGTGGSFLNQGGYGPFVTGGLVVGSQLWSHLILEAGFTQTSTTPLAATPTSSTGETRIIGGVGYTGKADAAHGGPVTYSAVLNVFHGIPSGATGGTPNVSATALMLTLTIAYRIPLFGTGSPPGSFPGTGGR